MASYSLTSILIIFGHQKRRYLVCQLLNMSKVKEPGRNLSQKLKKSEEKSVPALTKTPTETTSSPYFSPRRTRQKIKIEYEKPKIEIIEPSTSHQASVNNKTEKTNKKKDTKRPFPSQLDIDKEVKEETDVKEEKEVKEVKEAKWEPVNWREVLDNLKIMRKSVPAPVDTMGCDKCSDTVADEKTQRFHILVALMLSAQTKDQVTYEAMNRLKARGLTPENVINWDSTELEKTLMPVSFYKNKAKYIQKTAKILIEVYNSDIPNTLEGLLTLPGVGPKMAHICMNSAWNIVSGIGVDVHVHRICNRLKWVRKVTKQPEDTRKELESWLPAEHWSEVNGLLVGFGQTICSPVNPKCGVCLNSQICPSANLPKIKNKKTKP